MVSTVETAVALTRIGAYVFPVYVKKDPENPHRTTKKPGTPNGFLDATNDPYYVTDLFEKHPNAEVGVWMGPSGFVALDIDVKRSPDGEILVDGFESFEAAYLELPDTHSFESSSKAGGRQYIYAAPEGKTLNGTSRYRGMEGVDRRAGNSYSVWVGEVPESRDVFSQAPEWLCDVSTIRSAAVFEGTVKEWFDTLEPGSPNKLVRSAIDRVKADFEARGNDWDHAAVIERQFEAVRLGAEGNPGVPELLEVIEDLFFSRTGAHSRPENEWAYEFSEGLASGIAKYGDAIELRKSLPKYTLDLVPTGVPDSLVLDSSGEPTKEDFRKLLASLIEHTDDDLVAISVLWNAPRTKDLAREWGLEFVAKRVADARKTPEPSRENPTLEVVKSTVAPEQFLNPEESEIVSNTHTFIDTYLEATREKGFTNETYAIPAAWTVLSMAFGRRAFIPLSKPLEMNLWFVALGESTTGKGTEDRFLRSVLYAMFYNPEIDNYNLGALSSPDGLHIGLINRDDLPSIIHNDEAADFFRDIRVKDWMANVPDKLAKWYDGFVEPSSKISLKDARGKSAHTSLNQMMWGTPSRILSLLDASQFESGYLARVNWVWDGTIPDVNRKSDLKLQEGRKSETPIAVYRIASDLMHARNSIPDRFGISADLKVQKRLNRAIDEYVAYARNSPRFEFVKPAVDRLTMETLWKCAALLALYRGDSKFTMTDALVAIHYTSDWLRTLLKVAESISESPYSRDLEEIEKWIRGQGGSATRASLLHNFRGKVIRTKHELDDRIGYLVESGRINKVDRGGAVAYALNGGS
ncbi:MAG: putative bifunctional DNA primase/polymerase [Prokaryotic dsDNA virus sp.]|nr:MAG: putative bifunctional DNA primase/polymerase [Prokaryotic dsDNA virus sp.]|tara:strand:- start:44052 stop:46472 length:2421 start_codon:yes stop_codon:yes gene_type:complete